jgi:hypothetical protein
MTIHAVPSQQQTYILAEANVVGKTPPLTEELLPIAVLKMPRLRNNVERVAAGAASNVPFGHARELED